MMCDRATITAKIVFFLILSLSIWMGSSNSTIYASDDDRDGSCFDDGYEDRKDSGFDIIQYDEGGGSSAG